MNKKMIETQKKLSASSIWELQINTYQNFGMGAWSQQGVPFYITSNSFIAKNYAQVVYSFLADGLKNGEIDPKHPVYLFDLGAGSGRFAYLFLEEFTPLLSASPIAFLSIKYVMTDVAKTNLDSWKEHPYLKPYFDQKILDCAEFIHSQEESMTLHISAEVLDAPKMINPLILIANYFFDTIPQDLFRVRGCQLEEGRVTLFRRDEEFDGNLTVADLQLSYSFHPMSLPYYKHEKWNKILEAYSAQFQDCTFLFPTGALEVIDYFMRLSKNRLFLLAGDQGVSSKEQILEWEDPQISKHGSFSFPVSYDAIATFFHNQENGQAFLTDMPDATFVVMGGLLGKGSYFETERAFDLFINAFEPVDYWKMVSFAEQHWKIVSLEQILLLVKLGNWDPMCLHPFFQQLRDHLKAASKMEKFHVEKMLDKVAAHFYSISPEEGDFILNLGILYFDIGNFHKAIEFFENSIKISGKDQLAKRNIAASKLKLRGM